MQKNQSKLYSKPTVCVNLSYFIFIMFTCICCGEASTSLYTQYTKEIINFQLCKHCGKIVDKYVEYDFTIIAIDLLVCKIEAYRHILRNVEFPRMFQLFVLSCILNGILAWICTEDFEDFNVDAVQVAVNSELYFYIILKSTLSVLFGLTLFAFARILRYKIVHFDIVKLLILTNLCSLLGLLMHPWKELISIHFPQYIVFFTPTLAFICTVPTAIPSFKALTNASNFLSALLPVSACGVIFLLETAIIKLRFNSYTLVFLILDCTLTDLRYLVYRRLQGCLGSFSLRLSAFNFRLP